MDRGKASEAVRQVEEKEGRLNVGGGLDKIKQRAKIGTAAAGEGWQFGVRKQGKRAGELGIAKKQLNMGVWVTIEDSMDFVEEAGGGVIRDRATGIDAGQDVQGIGLDRIDVAAEVQKAAIEAIEIAGSADEKLGEDSAPIEWGVKAGEEGALRLDIVMNAHEAGVGGSVLSCGLPVGGEGLSGFKGRVEVAMGLQCEVIEGLGYSVFEQSEDLFDAEILPFRVADSAFWQLKAGVQDNGIDDDISGEVPAQRIAALGAEDVTHGCVEHLMQKNADKGIEVQGCGEVRIKENVQAIGPCGWEIIGALRLGEKRNGREKRVLFTDLDAGEGELFVKSCLGDGGGVGMGRLSHRTLEALSGG